jgi:hypothetical protein
MTPKVEGPSWPEGVLIDADLTPGCPIRSDAMSANRMNREEFSAKVSPLDAEQLRKVLWTLYWRGTAQARERIEDALTPEAKPKPMAKDVPEPDEVLADMTEFVSLARDGAYMYGDRRVTRTQRSKWRLTFRSLATQAQSALHAAETGPAEQAMELLIDLACEMHGSDYFHSDDPVEAARFVVSHAAAALWQTVLDQHGFAVFAGRAAPQLIRWESEYGWTRGNGKVAENEKLLAEVLEPMLTTEEEWRDFAAAYMDALDAVARIGTSQETGLRHSLGLGDGGYIRRDRARNLAAWHGKLAERLAGTADARLLDRLVAHRALAGPEVTFLRAQIARLGGQPGLARKLIADCLKELPGSHEFHEFAAEIGAELPSRAREFAAQQARAFSGQ